MEEGNSQNVAVLNSNTTNSPNPEVKNELTQSSNTKSILESICSDFQNIDVLSPKDKLLKKPDLPECSTSTGATGSKSVKKPFSNHVSTRTSPGKNQLQGNIVAIPSTSKTVPSNIVNTAENIKTLQHSDVKPVCIEGNSSKDQVISSSLAELADAEIVRTEDNCVSIVITNQRLIQVLNSEDSGQYQTVSTVSPVEAVSVEPSSVVQQDVTISSEINEVADEVVHNSNLKKGPKKRKYQFSSISKGKVKPPVYKPKPVNAKMTRARRVSAKMKTEWAKTLAKKGSLVCPMQGCYQKYVTIANFLTHYKFCAGQSELKPCPYCSSLIFTEKQAALHHMEVEHPEKLEEYKANMYDDESLEIYEVEEIIPKPPTVKVEKRKVCYSKENQSPKGKKLKIFKSIAHESEIENINEFRKCVRFDNIVSKINSCDQMGGSEELQTSVTPIALKTPKERRKRLIVTGKIVEEEKYFEDADEFLEQEPKVEENDFKLNTKSRLVLNLERYKQFNQHLKLTRDWSSARKTYSRSRISDSSLDNSLDCTMQSSADCTEDFHQLEDLYLQNTTGEDGSEVYYATDEPKELSEFDLESTRGIKKTRPSLLSETNSARKRVGILREKIENTKEIEPPSPPPLPPTKPTVFASPSPDKPLNGLVLKEKKIPCYLRDTIPNAASTPKTDSESARKPGSGKIGSIITYGKNVPRNEVKKIKTEKVPVVDFDTLFKNSMNEMKLLREKTESGKASEVNQDEVIEGKGDKVNNGMGKKVKLEKGIKGKQVVVNENGKENGIKEPIKRKRGRPRKIIATPEQEQPEPTVNQKANEKVIDEQQMLEACFEEARAKDLKNSQARAYIKSKKDKSIRNLNLRRSNRAQAAVASEPSTLGNTLENGEICNDISQQINKDPNDLTEKEGFSNVNETTSQNSSTLEENKQIEQQSNVVKENIDNINLEGTLPSHLEDEPKKGEVHTNQDNLKKSADSSLLDDSSISEKVISENEAKLEMSVKSDSETTVEDLSQVPPPVEQCPVEPQQAPSSCSAEIVKDATTPCEADSQIVENVVEPVKRRRGRPKKSIPQFKGKSQVADSNVALPSDSNIESKAVQDPVLQTEAAQDTILETEAVQISTEQAIAVQSQAVPASTAQSESDKIETVQSETEKSATEKSVLETSSIESSATDKIEEMQSGEVQSENVQSKSDQTVSVQPESEQCEAVLSTTEQTETEPSAAAQPVAEQSMMPVRKSLRPKRAKISSSNDDFVLLPDNKKEFEALTSPAEQIIPVKTGRRGRPRKYPLKSDLDSSANESLNESKNSIKDLSEQLPNSNEPAPASTELVVVKTGKRGRPRKVPLSDLNSTVSESDTSMLLTDTPNAVPERTGKRGRPRKYPLKHNLNTSTEITSSPNEGAISNISLRKSRKGRPVKCIHYEALNSQTALPPNGEAVSEKKAEENDENKVGAGETASANLMKDTQTEAAASKAEKFILPPKKRKIADEDEDISAAQEKSTKKLSEDPDYSAGEDASDDESDAEHSKKIRKTFEDLPYKPGRKKSKKLLKKLAPKKVAATSTKPNLQFLYDFTGGTYEIKELYSCFKPLQSMFTPLNECEWQEFLPPVDSVSVKIGTENSVNDWKKLKCFQSLINEAFKNLTLFVGGPVSTSAFCPTSSNKNCDQYIALASNYDLLKINYASTKPQRGLIQLYNLGDLQSMVPPVLELALCHHTATITDMQWCPRGCYEDLPDQSNGALHHNTLPRLGLLAVACTDSFVRIYSIPHPKCLDDWDVNTLPFYHPSPAVVLEPMNGATRASIATSLTWANTDDCEQIAVGYGNGMVCVWLVSTTNSILLSKESAGVKTILPYQVFQAHGTPVTSLQFAPLQNCRYLVSSGFDKTLKYFDLMDTSMPFCSAKRGCAINCQWSSSLCGAFVSLHDGITFKGSNYYKDSGTEEFPTQNVSGSISSLTQSRVSEAINALATADMKGAVSVRLINKSILIGAEASRVPPSITYKIFKTEVAPLQISIKEELEDVMHSVSNIQDVIDVATDLTSQVGTAIDSENKIALESSVSKVMDDILTVTVENSLKLPNNPTTQLVDAHVSDTEVLNLVSSLCETTVNSVNTAADKRSHLELESKCEESSLKISNNFNHETDNSDAKSEIPVVSVNNENQTTIDSTDSLSLNEKICSQKNSESSHLSDTPDISSHVSEILPSNCQKSNSSDSNSFVIEHDSEVTEKTTTVCNNDLSKTDKIQLENSSFPTKNSTVSHECNSQETIDTVDLSDEDSFSSEDNDSDKESDIIFDAESDFSNDSMMSECSLSSKSSESSFSSENAMDESISMDYNDDPDDPPRCSPEPNDFKSSELEYTPNESLSAKESLRKCEPTVDDSLLTKQSDQDAGTKHEDSSSTNFISPSPKIFSPIEKPSDQVAGTSECSQKDSSETLNNTSTISEPAVEESALPDEGKSSIKETSNDSVSTNMEPSVHEFYKQHTRTSKPFMQFSKSASEEGVCSSGNEMSASETVVKVESEASAKNEASYESIVSTHGIVFKDIFVGSKDDYTTANVDEMEKLPALELNNFSSVNTISWNPNPRCKYWLFTAGNSGIARLCCVSKINTNDHSQHKDT